MYSGGRLEVEKDNGANLGGGPSQEHQNEASSNPPDAQKKSRKGGSRLRTIVKTKVKKKIQDDT